MGRGERETRESFMMFRIWIWSEARLARVTPQLKSVVNESSICTAPPRSTRRAKAPEDWRSLPQPRDWRLFGCLRTARSVLDCGSLLPL